MPLSSSIFTRAALLAADYAGINGALRTYSRNCLAVACYHGVVPDEHPHEYDYRNTVSVRAFARQMELLTRWHKPVSAADIRDHIEKGTSLPARPVLVTFDDGYRNNLVHAAPVLERYGVPALISVTTGYVASKRLLWCEELRLRVLHWPKPKLPMPQSQPDVSMADDSTG